MDSVKKTADKPKVMKETKKKIKVDFERTDLKTRLKAKFLSTTFFGKIIWYIFRLVLLIGIAYIVLYPFIAKISGSLMSKTDFADLTVRLIPKNPTLNTYKALLTNMKTLPGVGLVNVYWTAFTNTLILSLSSALIQTFSCCLIAYGLAKFKFKGNNAIFLAVILTMVIPHSTIQMSLFRAFRYFDIFGIFKFLSGGLRFGHYDPVENAAWVNGLNSFLSSINILPDTIPITKTFSIEFANGTNFINTYFPLYFLSATGLAFKNGLYIFMLRQFFKGVPDELEESAYIDGAGTFRTFIQIILPLSVPMMITVFVFAFSWQWTDKFYVDLFISTDKMLMMPDIVDEIPASLQTAGLVKDKFESAIRNTTGLLIIAPLVLMYLFCQRYIIQGIERSGITG